MLNYFYIKSNGFFPSDANATPPLILAAAPAAIPEPTSNTLNVLLNVLNVLFNNDSTSFGMAG